MQLDGTTGHDAHTPGPHAGSAGSAATTQAVPPPAGPAWGGGPPPPGGYPPPYACYPPPYGGYPAPPPGRGTNGFAVASLVFGIIGMPLLGTIFGCVALSQVRKTGQDGRGMAVAGLALSALWAAFVALVVAALLLSEPSTPVDPQPDGIPVPTSASASAGTGAGGVLVPQAALKPGDCVNELRAVPVGDLVRDLPGVPCVEPHEAEVVGGAVLPGGPYPGESVVTRRADNECLRKLEEYSPSAAGDPAVQITYLYPGAQEWLADRSVTCFAVAASGTTTGSIANR